MAKKIPNPLARRHQLEKDLPAAQSLAIAEAYIEAGRVVEALDFLRKAEAEDRLLEVARDAMAAGDAFLFRSTAAALDKEPGRDEWLALAEAAASAGKDQYAAEARRQAEVGEG